MVAELYPEATLVALPANHGFSHAVNAGISAGNGEAVVLLNNDVRPEPHFLERIVEPLRSEPGVGMVAALLLQAKGDVVDSLGLEVDRTLAGFPRFWGAARQNGMLAATTGPTAPVGGAAAYRRSALEAVGGFDERMFAYSEDLELALRLRAAGWKCAAAPDAVGVHLGSASFGRNSRFQVYHRGWSRGYLLRRFGVLKRPLIGPRTLLGEGGTVAWQLLRTRDTSGLRGRVAGWRAARRVPSLTSGSIQPSVGFAEAVRRRRAYRAG